MPEPSPSLFRKESLERLSSPERLDTLMRVIDPKHWIPLLCLAAMILAGLLWSIFGRIPVSVTGQGVLIRPHNIVGLQVPAAGQLVRMELRAGATVRKGDVVGLIAQPEIVKDLELQKLKLAELEENYKTAMSFLQQRVAQETASVQRTREYLKKEREHITKRLAETERLAERIQSSNLATLTKKRESLKRPLELADEQVKLSTKRLETYRDLKEKGVIAVESVVDMETRHIEAVNRLLDLNTQLQEVNERELEVKHNYLEALLALPELRDKLEALELDERKLDVDEKRLAEEKFEAEMNHTQQVRETRRTIARLELDLERQTKVVSDYSGRVVELTAGVGQTLTAGTRLATIEVEAPDAPLVALCYFAVKEGKLIAPGTEILVSPETAKRERYGSMVAKVAWVSPFPVSPEAAANTVGNAELARALTADGRQIEVEATLQSSPSNFSGYEWTSTGGPPLKLTAGTSVSVRVTVEEEAPIALLLPFLKSLVGS